MSPAPSEELDLARITALLPERIWYLTTSGSDMWCRRPYGFFFTSADNARRFAGTIGSEHPLSPIAVASRELVSEESLAAMRRLEVTRLFVDPQIDPQSGDVFGTILRIAAQS
jgi:hypothetical protein